MKILTESNLPITVKITENFGHLEQVAVIGDSTFKIVIS